MAKFRDIHSLHQGHKIAQNEPCGCSFLAGQTTAAFSNQIAQVTSGQFRFHGFGVIYGTLSSLVYHICHTNPGIPSQKLHTFCDKSMRRYGGYGAGA